MTKKIFQKWQTKLVVISFGGSVVGLLLAILGDEDGFHWAEEPGLILFWAGIIGFALSLLIIFVFYPLIKFKNYKPLIVLIIAIIVAAVILFFTLPLEYFSLDRSGTLCQWRGGYFKIESRPQTVHVCYEEEPTPCLDPERCIVY